MKTVLITGASGQLGKQFCHDLKGRYDVYSLDRIGMDVTDCAAVHATLKRMQPDIVIHCAAYTKVDAAEKQKNQAFLVNAIGARNVAVAAENVSAKLVYMSTDYVFNGQKRTGYYEFDKADPINVYGASKYAGECFVKELHSRYFIVRTSWLYGKYGPNFVETMLRLAETKKEINIVNDQTGSPTYTKDLVLCVTRLMETNLYGTYHISNTGACTWYEFASAIFSLCNKQVSVRPITTAAFGAAAPRPPYSVLHHDAWRFNAFPPIRSWEQALAEYIMKRKASR